MLNWTCRQYALLERGRERRDPAGVALEGATEDELLSHDCEEWLLLWMNVGALVVGELAIRDFRDDVDGAFIAKLQTG